MAIQAQMYPENLGLPLMGGVGGSQDWLFMSNNNNINNDFHNLSNTNNVFFNGCGFNEVSSNNNLQQQKQQQQLQYLQQQQQQQTLLQFQQQYMVQLQNQQQQRNPCDNNNDGFAFLSSPKNCTTTTTTATTASTTTSGSCDYQMPMSFSTSFADQLEKQRQEVDRFITLQNERLKLALQEQRKQQLAVIMRKLEEKAMQLLRQKDEEIARSLKRRMELEEIIRKMEMENQEWQRLATENEAMVVSLNNTLVQLKEEQQQACCLTTVSSSSCSSNEVGDAESCCNFGNNNNNNEYYYNNNKNRETGVAETGEERENMNKCKVCKSGNSCILLLPCRHLCCCKACEAFVDACPVCKSAKMASIEALLS
ncbi:hypothetical protein BVRB_9g214010 [Beta vulgaris subsp. vulgaris]|nr:hypothetical protein BVRB_9g214010 [Beta vulgaris subsp. vulgaris]